MNGWGKLKHPDLTFPTPKKFCSDWNFEFLIFTSCATSAGAHLIKIWENSFWWGKLKHPALTFPTLYSSAPGCYFLITFWFGGITNKFMDIQMVTNIHSIQEHIEIIVQKLVLQFNIFVFFVKHKFLFLNAQCSLLSQWLHILPYR